MKSIEQIEREILGTKYSDPNLPIEKIVTCVKRTTICDEYNYQNNPHWAFDHFTKYYESVMMNEHFIKRFIMCDFPLSMIEIMYKDEFVEEFREIKSTYLLDNLSHVEISAQAFIENKIIFFSEGLFKFLWDYYTIPNFLRTFVHKKDFLSEEEVKQASDFQKKISLNIATGYYASGFNLDEILKLDYQDAIYKLNLHMATMFIYCHEIGHITLNHKKRANWFKFKKKAEKKKNYGFKIFNDSQIQELDADMFASDFYFNYVIHYLDAVPDNIRADIQISGLDFLKQLGYLELQANWDFFIDSEHPPSGIRLIYITLRHKEKYLLFGQKKMVDICEKAIESGKIPKYDFMKDLGTDKYFSRN